MFSMPILDVAIGLCFLYLLLGLICSTVNEMIASRLNTRARFLDKGIDRLLGGDDDLKRELYKHPLIKSMAASDAHICPSYIPASRFTSALLDILSGPGKQLNDVAALHAGAATTGNDATRMSLQALITPHADPAVIRKNIEDWFNDNMDRVGGWYKRNAQRNVLLLAVGVTLVLNADTLNIARVLWTDPTLRAAVVEQAKQRVASEPPADTLPMVEYRNAADATEPTPVHVPQSATEALSAGEKQMLGQLTGWDSDWNARKEKNFADWLGDLLVHHLIGWILTALAVSLGAPFWFDLLKKFMNIRSTGKPPEEPAQKESSGTTPPPAPAPAV